MIITFTEHSWAAQPQNQLELDGHHREQVGVRSGDPWPGAAGSSTSMLPIIGGPRQTDRAGGHEDMDGGGAPSPLLWPGTRGQLRAHTPVGPGGPSPRGISSQL